MYYDSYKGDLRLPELGKADRAIYNGLIAVTTVATVAGILAFLLLFLVVVYPLTDPNVAGVSHTLSIFGIIGFGVLMGLIINGLVVGRARRYPIFGAPGVTYGGPEWTQVYPLLMPTRQAPEQVRRLVRDGRQIVLIMAAGVLLAAFVFATSILSGNLLYRDGSVRVLWGPGWEMVHYAPENVEQIEVVQFQPRGGKSGLSQWRIDIHYQMDDGRAYSFQISDDAFQRDGQQSQVELLAEILGSYPKEIITFYDQGMIPRIVFDQGYSQEDQGILEELFGLR